ncbi:MAG: tRNA pseudouridine(38-40) synthase TruA [Gammaproteobacteria bacterium]|nr:tRNA pseudouridine(38-40) synthase TruA [Gammaproteobacteria bacterium]
MKIALGVEYDGSRYSGWQQQPHAPSVQEAVERALARVADHPVNLVCAGRTDAGVHACNQVVHFETGSERRERSWVLGCNSNLPDDININWARSVDETFHARFSATARSYRYVILNRWVRSALEANRMTWVHQPLDEQRMQRAARHLEGEHDFSSYRALACQAKSPVRTVEYIRVERNGELVTIDIKANAFLHHMVRNIAGVLVEIGKGEQPEDWSREVLGYRDRALGGVTAPPHGLYFLSAHYPDEYAIPERQLWLEESSKDV